jgi:hypothetical protein
VLRPLANFIKIYSSKLSTNLRRVKLTLSLFVSVSRIVLATKLLPRPRKIKVSTTTATNFVIVASDFLPTIHGGIYRPASWLRFASAQTCKLQLLTNTPKRRSNIGESLLTDWAITDQVHYCNESQFDVISTPARWCMTRPEFFLAALAHLEKLHQQQAFSHIIATGPDFTSFIIAAVFARRHRLHLHLDYRDEWTLSPFDFSEPTPLSRCLEQAAIKQADSISMTTQSQLDYFHQHFNFPGVTLLKPNGCDQFPQVAQVQNWSPEQLVICHSGNVGGHNSLTALISYFNQLHELIQGSGHSIRLAFCGAIAENQQQLLASSSALSLSLLGQMTPEQAFTHTINADICLLLVDERYQRYLPGKLFGYIASGKPILIFGADNCIEISTICEKYGVPHFFANFFANGAVNNMSACAEFLKNCRQLRTDESRLEEFRCTMDRQSLAKDFFESFKLD